MAIRWSGGDSPAEFLACDTSENAGLKEDIRQALWSVHLYVDGRRRT